MSSPSWFRKLARKRADCETASGELVLYDKMLWGVEFDRARNVKNKTIAIATEACGLGLRSRCSNRNKLSQPGCVERSGTRRGNCDQEGKCSSVHGRSNTEGPLTVTRA